MLGFTDRRSGLRVPARKSLAVATAVVLTSTGLAAAAGSASAAAPAASQVFTDSKTDVPSGVGLFRTRVTNESKLVIVTKHRNLRQHAFDNQFTIFIDTRKSHPGPDFAITGGMSDGTDWATGRATRRWKVRVDPLDPIGLCDSKVKLRYKDRQDARCARSRLPRWSPGSGSRLGQGQ